MGGDRVRKDYSQEMIFELGQMGKLFQVGKKCVSKSMHSSGIFGRTLVKR